MYIMAIIVILPVCMIDYDGHYVYASGKVMAHPFVYTSLGIMALCSLCLGWRASIGSPIFLNVSLKLMSFENITALKNTKNFDFG